MTTPRITTPRLELIPATPATLRAELAHRASVADALGVRAAESWPPELYERDDVERTLAMTNALGFVAGWAMWYVIERGAAEPMGTLVGVAGFEGPPDTEGSVQIGYGVVPEARGKGYATEATRELVAFALSDARVSRVIAENVPGAHAVHSSARDGGIRTCRGRLGTAHHPFRRHPLTRALSEFSRGATGHVPSRCRGPCRRR